MPNEKHARESLQAANEVGAAFLVAGTAEIERLKAENERLRKALHKAAGRLGYLSTALSLSNKANNAKGAWEWSEEARRDADRRSTTE